MSAKNQYSFFKSVEKSFDKAAVFTPIGIPESLADKTMQQRVPDAISH